MGTKEISAAWLVAAAILGLFGWLQLAGVRSGGVPLAADASLRVPVVAPAFSGGAGPTLAEDYNLSSNPDALAAGDHDERICDLALRTPRC